MNKQGDSFLFVSHQSFDSEADNKPPVEPANGSSTESKEADNQTVYDDIAKIEIKYFDYTGSINRSVIITDFNLISDITSMISQSKSFSDDQWKQIKQKTEKRAKNKMVLTDKNGNKKEVIFANHDLNYKGYIQFDGQQLDPGNDFFRYLFDYDYYSQHDSSLDNRVIELLGNYGWTADYLVNSVMVTIPSDLKHKAGEFPLKLYWAYNNELSASIGLDFSGYMGEEVTAEIYRLREPIPNSVRSARGIIIKYKGEIIGAYIDSGRHNGFACSLERKSLEDVTGKDWGKWIEGYIDYSDELEIEISSMSLEKIIRQHFEYIDGQDVKTVYACMTRKSLCGYLFVNMDNSILYNNSFDSAYSDGYLNVNSIKLIDMSEMKEMDNPDGVIEYQVRVDYDLKSVITFESGVQLRFVILTKETEQGGWRISSVGTGP